MGGRFEASLWANRPGSPDVRGMTRRLSPGRVGEPITVRPVRVAWMWGRRVWNPGGASVSNPRLVAKPDVRNGPFYSPQAWVPSQFRLSVIQNSHGRNGGLIALPNNGVIHSH
jgi:hypothetical protein